MMACKGVEIGLLFSYVLVLGRNGITKTERIVPKFVVGFYFPS